jgi:hypothetical protein
MINSIVDKYILYIYVNRWKTSKNLINLVRKMLYYYYKEMLTIYEDGDALLLVIEDLMTT